VTARRVVGPLPPLNQEAYDQSRVMNELARAKVHAECAWAEGLVGRVLRVVFPSAEEPGVARIGAATYA